MDMEPTSVTVTFVLDAKQVRPSVRMGPSDLQTQTWSPPLFPQAVFLFYLLTI